MNHGRLLLIAITIGVTGIANFTRADIDGFEQIPFETVVDTSPIVVIARAGETTRTTVERYKKNVEKPFMEVYTHYQLQVERVLKGKIAAKSVEVRLPGGKAKSIKRKPALTFVPHQRIVVVLTPDIGKYPSGKKRKGYLIPYKAKYPLVKDRFEVATPEGVKQWSVDDLAALIRKAKVERRRWLEKAPEPKVARGTPVIGGEPGPGKGIEKEPPSAKQTRETAKTPMEKLRKATPLERDTPTRHSKYLE